MESFWQRVIATVLLHFFLAPLPFREIGRSLTINKPSFEKGPIKYRNGVLFSNRNCETGDGKLFDFRGYLGRKPSSDRLFEFRGL